MLNMSDMCCGFTNCSQALPQDPELAYAYVPIQCLNKVYTYEKALDRGTLFPELDKPMSVYGREFKERCKGYDNSNCNCNSDCGGEDNV